MYKNLHIMHNYKFSKSLYLLVGNREKRDVCTHVWKIHTLWIFYYFLMFLKKRKFCQTDVDFKN
mgnify:CR=1 FL=1